jgi:hypothetical protein
MKSKNTSILAPEYYYKVAKRDFGSVSRFFRVMMEGYIKTKYHEALQSDDIISDCEIVDILLEEKEKEKSFVNDTLNIVKTNQLNEQINDLETDVIIHETLNKKDSELKRTILNNKDYFESIFNRIYDDSDNLNVPPFNYIEKKYGLNQNQVLDLLQVFEDQGVLDENSIEGLV